MISCCFLDGETTNEFRSNGDIVPIKCYPFVPLINSFTVSLSFFNKNMFDILKNIPLPPKSQAQGQKN